VENDINAEFEQKLRNYFHNDIYKLCHTASEINSSLRKIDELKEFENEFKQKSAIGFTDKKEHDEYREKFARKMEEAVKAKTKIEKMEQDSNGIEPVKRIINRIVNDEIKSGVDSITLPVNDSKPKLRINNLSSLNKEQRKFAGRIFVIIREVLDPDIAENLIQKIEEELK
jgi:molecular chaperone HtpG